MVPDEQEGSGMSPDSSPAKDTRRIDRVLAPDYLAAVGSIAIAELRELRTDAEQEESDLSYLRRMVQGRLDVIRAELNRRDGTSSGSLVADLATILADEPRGPARGLGRHITVEPSRADSHRRYVEALIADVDLSDVAARSTDELGHAMHTLSEEEQALSAKRREVQTVMDACSAELIRRYKDGEADVATILREQS